MVKLAIACYHPDAAPLDIQTLSSLTISHLDEGNVVLGLIDIKRSLPFYLHFTVDCEAAKRETRMRGFTTIELTVALSSPLLLLPPLLSRFFSVD